MTMRLRRNGLDDPRVVALIELHQARAREVTIEGTPHAFDVRGLMDPAVSFWTVWEGETLLGMGAWKRLSADHGEIKSMHVAEAARGRGVGGVILDHLVNDARAEGIRRLSLETGVWPYFHPAHALYSSRGFSDCPAFPPYAPDPHSRFMSRDLDVIIPAS